MKKNLLYLLLFVGGLFSACDDNDAEYIFDKSINERFAEMQAEYNTKLIAPENGWLGYYTPNGETGAFSLLLKFREDGTVIMHSDYDGGNANDTITYSITKKQDITIVFESWSVLHAIYETDNNNFGGEYVFNLTEVTDDQITLTSKTDNGYGDDVVTELILIPATIDNWNFEQLYESQENLIGDATKSVFRNFKLDDVAIASFSYSESSRTVNISYMENELLVSKSIPLKITTDGFCLLESLTINNITLECFIYDTDADSFIESSSGVSLEYDTTPGVPLTYYDFGSRGNMRYNYLEPDKSSQAFLNFYEEYTNWAASNNVEIQKWYIRDLNLQDSDPYIHIYFGYGSGNYSASYSCTYEVREDGKIYFTFTEADANAQFLDDVFQPLVQKIFNSEGHYIEGTGGLLNYTNGTFSLINADDPSLKINFYDFN